ncbi:MAG: 2-octaprenyl-6-methoxyphenyl hydroxylase, partial [Cycloclasticus sp.]
LVIGFTDKLVKLFSSDNAAFSTLRNSGLLLMDKLPVLKNQFAQQTMGLAARLPRLRGES